MARIFGTVLDLPEIVVAAHTLDVRQEFVQNIGAIFLVGVGVEALEEFVEHAGPGASMAIITITLSVYAEIWELLVFATTFGLL